MFKVKFLTVVLVLVLAASAGGCRGTPPSEPSREGEALSAAAAALAEMGGGDPASAPGTAPEAQGSSSRGSAAGPEVSRGEPAWVAAPYAVYNEGIYVAALGHGTSRETAEKNALAALTSVFGQSVQAELKTLTYYSEAVLKGVINISDDISVQNAINTSAKMDALVGAEIRDVWYDGKAVYYAVAVMDRAKTAVLYRDMILSNERLINRLITLPEEEKNTLEGVSRYQLAALIADTNRVYSNVLSLTGRGLGGIDPGALKQGDDYRAEAMNLIRNIPIAVEVSGDKNSRIRSAFAAALAGEGFKSGGTNTRYVLKAALSLEEVVFSNQQNKFTRYVIDANLIDTLGNTVLLPFIINGREGHLSLAEAENRALTAAERRIRESYGEVLSEYLTTRLPGK
ncbi:MAG: LPP20 family lipoprotein [Treponema sp.]|jgi:hypothetical protein|nr:LPP20 family lipoprotein [Treponema sp.]